MSRVIKVEDQYYTFHHYKEPLREVENGYGYYGALCGSLDGKLVLCHICGHGFARLHLHARQKHGLSNTEYKDRFQLAKMTALVSDEHREKMKQLTLKWLSSMSPEQKQAFSQRRQERMSEWRKTEQALERVQPKETLESKNKKGTCPDQLLEKIREVTRTLGRTPSLAEFITETGGQRFRHLIFTTFGSWLNALKIIGLEPKERKTYSKRTKWNREMLLEYLRDFAHEHNTIPTATDSKRGLIPHYEIFQRYFNTFEEARKLAGVYEIIQQ